MKLPDYVPTAHGLCVVSHFVAGDANEPLVRSFCSRQSVYQGKFGLHGRYQTYGQHSFIYDLIAAAYRRGVRVTLLVEGLSGFPLAEPLKKYAHVFELDEATQLGTVDLVLVDQPTDKLVKSLPAGCPAICIIHKKDSVYSREVQDRCDQFLCMTEAALEYQSTRIPVGKLRMVHHGVA